MLATSRGLAERGLTLTYLVGSDGLLRLRYGGARNWRARATVDHLTAQLL